MNHAVWQQGDSFRSTKTWENRRRDRQVGRAASGVDAVVVHHWSVLGKLLTKEHIKANTSSSFQDTYKSIFDEFHPLNDFFALLSLALNKKLNSRNFPAHWWLPKILNSSTYYHHDLNLQGNHWQIFSIAFHSLANLLRSQLVCYTSRATCS